MKKFDFEKWIESQRHEYENSTGKIYTGISTEEHNMALSVVEAAHAHYQAEFDKAMTDLYHTSSHKICEKLRKIEKGES